MKKNVIILAAVCLSLLTACGTPTATSGEMPSVQNTETAADGETSAEEAAAANETAVNYTENVENSNDQKNDNSDSNVGIKIASDVVNAVGDNLNEKNANGEDDYVGMGLNIASGVLNAVNDNVDNEVLDDVADSFSSAADTYDQKSNARSEKKSSGGAAVNYPSGQPSQSSGSIDIQAGANVKVNDSFSGSGKVAVGVQN